MTERMEKKIIIIAGPNGAGKTTFAVEFLPNEAACPFCAGKCRVQSRAVDDFGNTQSCASGREFRF